MNVDKVKNESHKTRSKQSIKHPIKSLIQHNNDIVTNLLKIISYVEYNYNSEWIIVKVIKIYLDDNSIDIELPNCSIRNTLFNKIRKISLPIIVDNERDEANKVNKVNKANKVNKSNKWRKIKRGMSKKEVINILGDPYHIKCNNQGEIWNYNKMLNRNEILNDNSMGILIFDIKINSNNINLKYWNEPSS
jgi:hypothetical protein